MSFFLIKNSLLCSKSLSGEFVAQKKLNQDMEQPIHSRNNFTRKLIHRVADTSISGIRVAGERTDIAKYHNLPEFIVCSNCSEFRSSVMFKWYQDNKVDLSFIASGKPQQNAYLESFTGKFRKECLDINCFTNLYEIREVNRRWKNYYNFFRPHISL